MVLLILRHFRSIRSGQRSSLAADSSLGATTRDRGTANIAEGAGCSRNNLPFVSDTPHGSAIVRRVSKRSALAGNELLCDFRLERPRAFVRYVGTRISAQFVYSRHSARLHRLLFMFLVNLRRTNHRGTTREVSSCAISSMLQAKQTRNVTNAKDSETAHRPKCFAKLQQLEFGR